MGKRNCLCTIHKLPLHLLGDRNFPVALKMTNTVKDSPVEDELCGERSPATLTCSLMWGLFGQGERSDLEADTACTTA